MTSLNDLKSLLFDDIEKDNNEKEMFNKLMDRSLELCPEEYSRQVEEYYEQYIKENARKGNRK